MKIKPVDLVGVRPVNVDPIHQRCRRKLVLVNVESLDLFGRARLLGSKLIAWEEQQPHPSVRVFGAEGNQPRNLPEPKRSFVSLWKLLRLQPLGSG